jgi:hypothetical protein
MFISFKYQRPSNKKTYKNCIPKPNYTKVVNQSPNRLMFKGEVLVNSSLQRQAGVITESCYLAQEQLVWPRHSSDR